jgi:hypothetical protein
MHAQDRNVYLSAGTNLADKWLDMVKELDTVQERRTALRGILETLAPGRAADLDVAFAKRMSRGQPAKQALRGALIAWAARGLAAEAGEQGQGLGADPPWLGAELDPAHSFDFPTQPRHRPRPKRGDPTSIWDVNQGYYQGGVPGFGRGMNGLGTVDIAGIINAGVSAATSLAQTTVSTISTIRNLRRQARGARDVREAAQQAAAPTRRARPSRRRPTRRPRRPRRPPTYATLRPLPAPPPPPARPAGGVPTWVWIAGAAGGAYLLATRKK